MDFGKLTDEELKHADLTLPPDGAQTSDYLNSNNSNVPEFYIGCAKWGRKEWVNLIYPNKTKEADFLNEYVKHFNSIELNATFYNIPKPDLIRGWKEKANLNSDGDFIFCPKFSRVISHIKRLNNAEKETDQFLSAISEFENFLGPCFLQLSDNFGPKNFEVLENYLKGLPLDLKVFVELRHKDWFLDPNAKTAVFDMLAKLNKGAIITDVSGRRDCLHMELTSNETFIRFVGNGEKHQSSDFKRIDDWVIRLQSWMDKGLEKVYFFLHQHDEKDTPILAEYTIEQFNLHLKSKISEITFIPKIAVEGVNKSEKLITKQGGLF
jgi:uncharacterized protein YecE (DUF72 family)